MKALAIFLGEVVGFFIEALEEPLGELGTFVCREPECGCKHLFDLRDHGQSVRGPRSANK